MGRQHNLRKTITIYFCLFGLVLTVLYGTVVFFGLRQLEDRLFINQLKSFVETYLKEVANGTPQLSPPGLTTYIGTEQMPDSLFDLVGRYPLGYHELQFNQSDTEYELQFAIQQLPGKEQRVYFIYDVSGLEVSETRQNTLILLLILAGVLVCCFGLIIGFFLARRITLPLGELTQKIQSFTGNDLPTQLVPPGASDEVLFLGRSLEQANERINQFIIREKEFTRNASHELRTPLTAIQGAAELLEKRFLAEHGHIPRALERVTRSVKEMELTIDTFLMLAREDELAHYEQVDINQLCRDIVNEMRDFINHQDKEIRLTESASSTVWAPPLVIRIVLGNLLRNAVQHSSGNCITVQVTDNSLHVSDDGGGMDSDVVNKVLQPGVRSSLSGGTGFGLTIIDRICTRLSWQLDIQSSTETGTRISVLFGSE